MRHGLHQYEEALALGRAHRLPEERLEGMAQEYFRLLVDTKQEERAAALKEKEVCICVCARAPLSRCCWPLSVPSVSCFDAAAEIGMYREIASSSAFVICLNTSLITGGRLDSVLLPSSSSQVSIKYDAGSFQPSTLV